MLSFEEMLEQNAMKLKWVKTKNDMYYPDPNDQCFFDFLKRKFTMISKGRRYVYPLKIMYTVGCIPVNEQGMLSKNIHLAWDNHPMNFNKKIVYNGFIREFLERFMATNSGELSELLELILQLSVNLSHDSKGSVYNVYHDDIFYVLYLE